MHSLQDDTVGGGPIWGMMVNVPLYTATRVDLGALRDRSKEIALRWVSEHGAGFEGFPEEYLRQVARDIETVVETAQVNTDEEGNIYISTHDSDGGYIHAFAVRPIWFI